MPRKLLVAMRLEVAHHFIEGSSARRFRWLEPPAAFGAAETSKTWFLDPYQLPGHGHASYRTRISLVCRASYKLNRLLRLSVRQPAACAALHRNGQPGIRFRSSPSDQYCSATASHPA